MIPRTVPSPIATAARFAVVLFLATSLLALEPVKVSTPATGFSVAGSHGQTDDVAGGRRFRAAAGDDLTIRGVLRVPPSRSGVQKTQQLQGLVVHFLASNNGPTLQSVAICNGANCPYKFDTQGEGNYTTRAIANVNMWALRPPAAVGSQSTVALVVRFHGGFEGNSHPGEFVLTSVEAEFAPEPLVLPAPSATLNTGASKTLGRTPSTAPAPAGAPAVLPAASNVGVIYAVANNYELTWYRHEGSDDGSRKWAAERGRKVGSGWDFQQLFPGGDGVIYAIKDNGDLLWYRNDGISDGTFRWAANNATTVGTGWNFKQVFSAGGGVIYAITADGDLMWYRHNGRRDGSSKWAANQGKKVGEGWNYEHVFAGGGGVLYAINANGDLLWFRHDGAADGGKQWTAPEGKAVGTGWNFKQVFSAGGGVIYAITADGDLMWYRHDGFGDGSIRWADNHGRKIGNGWDVKEVFSGATLEP